MPSEPTSHAGDRAQPEATRPDASPAVSPAVEAARKQARQRTRVLRGARLALVGVAIAGLFYLQWRFELLSIPEEACSPILAFEPGTRLLVDRHPEHIFHDDLVLYELPTGELSYGRISTPPGQPAGTERIDSGYWILGDNPTCPVPDSNDHGTFASERIAARVLFPLNF